MVLEIQFDELVLLQNRVDLIYFKLWKLHLIESSRNNKNMVVFMDFRGLSVWTPIPTGNRSI